MLLAEDGEDSVDRVHVEGCPVEEVPAQGHVEAHEDVGDHHREVGREVGLGVPVSAADDAHHQGDEKRALNYPMITMFDITLCHFVLLRYKGLIRVAQSAGSKDVSNV